jgi:hypothetical protein
MRKMYREPDEAGRRFLTVFDLDTDNGQLAEVVGVMSVDTHEPHLSLEDAGVRTPYTTEQIREYHGIKPEDKTVDILTVAIKKELRAKEVEGTTIMAMLEGMFVRVGTAEGWQHVVSMIDRRAWRVLKAIGAPFEPMHGYDETFEYCGSPETLALYGNFKRFGPSVAEHYQAYRFTPQRLKDMGTVILDRLIGRRNDASKQAIKRLGTYGIARNIITGRGVLDRVVLPEAAMHARVS